MIRSAEDIDPAPRVNILRRVNDTAIYIALILSLAVLFIPASDRAKVILAAVVIVGLITSWGELNRVVRLCTVVSVGSGAIAAFAVGADIVAIARGFTQMSAIFAFFVLVRLLELPILTGGFNRAVARTLNQRFGLQRRSSAGGALTYGLASGLSVGSVPISYRTLEALWADDARDDVRGIGKTVAQSFTAANAWTPISPIVAITLETTVTTLGRIILWMMPLTVVAVVYTIWRLRDLGEIRLGPAAEEAPSKSTLEFTLAVAALVVSLVVIDALTGVGPMGAAMISIVIALAIWQPRLTGRRAVPQLVRALSAQRPSWPEHFTLFCSGGLLVGAGLAIADSATGLPFAEDNLLLTLAIVPTLMVVAALLGLYPFVSLAALGALLGTQIVSGGGVIGLAIALITGASVGFLMSPFSGLTLLVSGMSGVSSFKIGLVWNREFGLVFLAGGTTLALFSALVV